MEALAAASYSALENAVEGRTGEVMPEKDVDLELERVMTGLLRSKGFLWLACTDQAALYYSHAGERASVCVCVCLSDVSLHASGRSRWVGGCMDGRPARPARFPSPHVMCTPSRRLDHRTHQSFHGHTHPIILTNGQINTQGGPSPSRAWGAGGPPCRRTAGRKGTCVACAKFGKEGID